MKKILMAAMAIIVALGNLNAQPKDNERAWWKQAKQFAKSMTKEGWKIDGSTPLENAFYEHIKKTHMGEEEIISDVSENNNAQTLNLAKQWASANAASMYAREAGAKVTAALDNALLDGAIKRESKDQISMSYQSAVQKTISGELQKSFGMYKVLKNGNIVYKAYYTVPEEISRQARVYALDNVKREIELAPELQEQLTKYAMKSIKSE